MASRPFRLDAPLDFRSLGDIPGATRRLERLGFDGAWTHEGVHDPFLPLATAAPVSTRLTLGTAVALAFSRSPMLLAYLAWDLQRATCGRFILGLGTQVRAHIERRFSAAWDPPGPRLREVVLAIRAIWERWQHGTPLEFRGQYYSFTLMPAPFVPEALDWYPIPIYVAGVNPYSCRLAGEIADGLHVHPLHTAGYLHQVIVPNVAEGLVRSQRRRSHFTIAVSAFIGSGRTVADVDRLREVIRAHIAFYASTRAYRAVMDLHAWGEATERLRRLSLAEQWSAMPKEVSDEMIAEFAIIGREDDVIPALISRYGGLADRVTPYPLGEARDRERLLTLLSRGLPK